MRNLLLGIAAAAVSTTALAGPTCAQICEGEYSRAWRDAYYECVDRKTAECQTAPDPVPCEQEIPWRCRDSADRIAGPVWTACLESCREPTSEPPSYPWPWCQFPDQCPTPEAL